MNFSSVQSGQNICKFNTIRFSFSLIFLTISFILSPAVSLAQSTDNAAVKGKVTKPDGRPLAYATVVLNDGKSGQTDENGKYLIRDLSAGSNVIRVSMVGYQTAMKNIELYADSTIEASFELQPGGTLSEIVVTAGRKAESINEVPSSVSILTAHDVKEQLSVNPSVAAILGNTIPGLGTATNKATN